MRDEKKIEARKEELYQQEISEGIEKYVWMSFCDSGKPKGHQFLGVIITKAFGCTGAMWKTHKMGINPGGEIMMSPCPVEDFSGPQKQKIDSFCDRLLTKEEAEGLDDIL